MGGGAKTMLGAGRSVSATSPSTVHWTKAVIPVVVIVGAIGMTQIYPGRARAKARDTRG